MSTLGELSSLVEAELVGDPALVVTDVVADSRSVPAGALFCCVRGDLHDGHDHAGAAVASGAVALLCERPMRAGVPELRVGDTRQAMGPVAAAVHGNPSEHLQTVGVTGTNGKTTVVNMIEAVLSHAGRSARSIGTLTGERTTPEAPELQRLLAGYVAAGVDAVALEVSSHALVQHRVGGTHFDVGVFTMLGTDHMDFHRTPEAYFAAKARLFDPGRCDAAVVNVDDVHGRLLRDGGDDTVFGVGLSDAGEVTETSDGSEFTWRGRAVRLSMLGRHNVMNALLTAETCRILGVDLDTIAAGLGSLLTVPGRFERFSAPDAPTVVVDYAHTPDALEVALEASRVRVAARGRVIVVFGCGGDRDSAKRPMMGAVACEGADRVIVTNDNPRSEDPARIIEQILAGCSSDVDVIEDRATAIRAAVREADVGDLVLVAGKGHEQGQVIGSTVLPFDDREVVRAALGQRGGAR